MPKSYQETKKNYSLSANLSNSWISRYYPKLNFKFKGVAIETVQAFSQHYFLSCLFDLENQSGLVMDVWANYPLIVNRGTNRFKKILEILFRTYDLVKDTMHARKQVQVSKIFPLIILGSGRHIEELFGLITFLHRKYDILVVGKLNEHFKKQLSKSSIDYFDFQSGLSFLDRFSRLKYLAYFVSRGQRSTPRVYPFGSHYWKKRLWFLRLVQFPEIVSLLSLANKLLSLSSARLLLTTTSNDLTASAFCLMAHKLGIPSAEIQHGIWLWETDAQFYRSDYELMWSKQQAEIVKNMRQVKIEVGSPFLKKYAVGKNDFAIQKKKTIGILVLLAPPFGTEAIFRSIENGTVTRDLINGLSKLPNRFLITVRAHPSYNKGGDFKAIDLPSNFGFSTHPLADDIKNNDIVLTGATTAGFQAMLYKKPLFFFHNSWLQEVDGNFMTKSGAAVNVPIKSLPKIDRVILKFIGNPRALAKQRSIQDKVVKNCCDAFGKDSYQKIFDFIEHVIHS